MLSLSYMSREGERERKSAKIIDGTSKTKRMDSTNRGM